MSKALSVIRYLPGVAVMQDEGNNWAVTTQTIEQYRAVANALECANIKFNSASTSIGSLESVICNIS